MGEILSLKVVSKLSGKTAAVWTGYRHEMPSAWEIADALCIAFAFDVVDENGKKVDSYGATA